MAPRTIKEKTPVTLRRKDLKHGRESLYLDIYLNGKRSYEFLNLYLTNGTSAEHRKKDKETLMLAESIRAKRLVEIRNKEYGFKSEYRPETKFFPYYRHIMEERKKIPHLYDGHKNGGNYDSWRSALYRLEQYFDEDITFGEIDRDACAGFKTFLQTKCFKRNGEPISANTVYGYFNKFKATINTAHDARIMPYNPLVGFDYPKEEETQREFLELEEIKKLIKTPFHHDVLKRAFLFSCLTGLRWSDIKKLKWSEVREHEGRTRLFYRQRKTGTWDYLDISSMAIPFMGERGEDSQKVFHDLKYSSYYNTQFARWLLSAGISKKITFHCGRHSFASLMADLDENLFTIQKLLGHKDFKTTLRYAKMLDKKRRAAVDKIPNVFDDDDKKEA